jgi:hypothetical protein
MSVASGTDRVTVTPPEAAEDDFEPDPDDPQEVIGSPFAMVPMWVALNSSSMATALYIALVSFVNIKRGDRRAWPTEKTLARRIGLSDRRMRPYLKELQELGAVDVRVHRYGPNRMKRRNVYLVRFDPPPGFEGYLTGEDFDAAMTPDGTLASSPVRTPASPELDELQNYKNNPPPTPREQPAAGAVPQPREGGEELESQNRKIAEVMDRLVDAWEMSDSDVRKGSEAVAAALASGWTPEQIFSKATARGPGGLGDRGAGMAARLAKIVETKPPRQRVVIEPCGDCNPFRRLEDADGNDMGSCPKCNPATRKDA